jgi:hypothetical protein
MHLYKLFNLLAPFSTDRLSMKPGRLIVLKRCHALQAVLYLVLCGCQTPLLRSISEHELIELKPDYLDSYQQEIVQNENRNFARILTEYQTAALDATQPQSFDVLVLSGGGAFGAFSVGFLKGWEKVVDPGLARPQFDSVSGVSTGALIAPFAFVGDEDAYAKITEVYSNPRRDWVIKRGLIPYLPGNVSLYDVSNLKLKIKSMIDAKLVQKLSIGASENRQLLIGATNIDFGMLKVWDIARIARNFSAEESQHKINSILLASSAIPGAFPPVVMDKLMYVDGGAAMQMVSGIDQRNWVYSQNLKGLDFLDRERPIRLRIWIIVNQKLISDPEVVRSRWTHVSERSLYTMMRSSMLQTIQDMETYMQFIDQLPEFDAEMRFVSIPEDFVIADSDEMFDAKIMRDLMTLGHKMGADPGSWQTQALRPAAPFQEAD